MTENPAVGPLNELVGPPTRYYKLHDD